MIRRVAVPLIVGVIMWLPQQSVSATLMPTLDSLYAQGAHGIVKTTQPLSSIECKQDIAVLKAIAKQKNISLPRGWQHAHCVMTVYEHTSPALVANLATAAKSLFEKF